jgi:hypothetical protein
MERHSTIPKWVPASRAPKRHLHPVWVENTSFDVALRIFKARALKTTDSRGSERFFFLSLSSGRCAPLTCSDNFPQSVHVSLELHGSGTRSIGYVKRSDMVEILQPLGITFQKPAQQMEPRWR